MGDLISRKALLEELVKAEQECEEVMCVPSWATALGVIRSQPTAYDVDKVVRKLEEASCYIEDGDGHAGHLVFTDETIEIVRNGGKLND